MSVVDSIGGGRDTNAIAQRLADAHTMGRVFPICSATRPRHELVGRKSRISIGTFGVLDIVDRIDSLNME